MQFYNIQQVNNNVQVNKKLLELFYLYFLLPLRSNLYIIILTTFPFKSQMNLQKESLFKDESTLFYQKYEQQLQNSTLIPIQVSCPFYVITSRQENHNSSLNCTYLFELCISGEWIFQREINTKKVVSAFRCDYQKSFELIMRNGSTESSQILLSGIRISFSSTLKAAVEFFITADNSSALLQFTKILQTKHIFQQGFFHQFKPIKRLGNGTTSIVYSVLHLREEKSYAVKCSKKKMTNEISNQEAKKSFINQISIWNRLDHPNIAKLHFTYQSQNSIYMVTELLSVTLLNFIKRYGFPKREISKKIIRELLEAIQYLHDRGIMHRDIKLQNIMIKKDQEKRGEITAMLIDFGLAYDFENSNQHLVRCGTPGYTAPEILTLSPNENQLKYSHSCDIFSLGIVAFTLLLKKFPFQGKNIEQILRLNIECSIKFSNDSNHQIDQFELDFLSRMLKKDPQERINVKQALKHPFLKMDDYSKKSQETFRNQKLTSVELTYNQ